MSELLINALSRPHFVAYHHIDAKHKIAPALFKLLGGSLIGWTVIEKDINNYNLELFDTVIFEELP